MVELQFESRSVRLIKDNHKLFFTPLSIERWSLISLPWIWASLSDFADTQNAVEVMFWNIWDLVMRMLCGFSVDLWETLPSGNFLSEHSLLEVSRHALRKPKWPHGKAYMEFNCGPQLTVLVELPANSQCRTVSNVIDSSWVTPRPVEVHTIGALAYILLQP